MATRRGATSPPAFCKGGAQNPNLGSPPPPPKILGGRFEVGEPRGTPASGGERAEQPVAPQNPARGAARRPSVKRSSPPSPQNQNSPGVGVGGGEKRPPGKAPLSPRQGPPPGRGAFYRPPRAIPAGAARAFPPVRRHSFPPPPRNVVGRIPFPISAPGASSRPLLGASSSGAPVKPKTPGLGRCGVAGGPPFGPPKGFPGPHHPQKSPASTPPEFSGSRAPGSRRGEAKVMVNFFPILRRGRPGVG